MVTEEYFLCESSLINHCDLCCLFFCYIQQKLGEPRLQSLCFLLAGCSRSLSSAYLPYCFCSVSGLQRYVGVCTGLTLLPILYFVCCHRCFGSQRSWKYMLAGRPSSSSLVAALSDIITLVVQLSHAAWVPMSPFLSQQHPVV